MDYIGGNYDTKKTKQYTNQPFKINQLVRSGLQFGIKMFWPHKATKLVDKLGLLGENQWGTKPLCSAEQPALMDEFITDVHRITCRNMAKLQNDATECYDRMISNLTSLVSRSYHVPGNACKIEAHALKAMK